MKLTKKQMVMVSFMLFSLFFGAGNLIFPPFLGQYAGSNTPLAILGFLITAVVLPVLGIIVVAQFNGLDLLARHVGKRFSIIFTILIYLSIGPGLGIPRAASVPFEMAIAPYLGTDANLRFFMLLYSLAFFLIALWLALTPNKLVERIGKFLTPSLLILIVFLFFSFIFNFDGKIAPANDPYINGPIVRGFLEGYNTMDTIAALNFGLVISTVLHNLHIDSKKGVIKHTIFAGIAAGTILSLVYLMLAYIGMSTSAVYDLQLNGAAILRLVVHDIFGEFGAIILATIFTLACLTTCVGLITSISQYFTLLFKKINYRTWAIGITFFSFIVCNQGLNVILSISVPVLNMIYPTAIMLIIMGLLHNHLSKIKNIYPITITAVGSVSVIYALFQININIPFITDLCLALPLFKEGLSWIIVSFIFMFIAYLLNLFSKNTDKLLKN